MWLELLGLLFSADVLSAGVRLSTPLLFAALGETVSERAGVLNIGLEGMMLAGCLAGFLAAYFSGSVYVGLLAAMAAGGGVAFLHALVCLTFGANQIVSGIAINLLMLGLTAVLNRAILGITSVPARITSFAPIRIPVLSDIPFLGQVLFQHTALTYLALALVPAMAFLLFKTTWGLQIRSVGENPRAADTVAIRVNRTRYVCTVVAGAFAGLGGAALSLGQLNLFVENMTAGRGFIALAAVIFGRWNPAGVLVACMLFGVADALQLRLQAFDIGIPYQLLVILPYVLTLRPW